MKRRMNGARAQRRARREGALSRYCREGKTPYSYTAMYTALQRREPDSALAQHRRLRGES